MPCKGSLLSGKSENIPQPSNLPARSLSKNISEMPRHPRVVVPLQGIKRERCESDILPQVLGGDKEEGDPEGNLVFSVMLVHPFVCFSFGILPQLSGVICCCKILIYARPFKRKLFRYNHAEGVGLWRGKDI